ncbi:MAG TPA: TetR family transcriptional regulator [Hyphomonadaceae bacterium]|nr:TetR family transcriptional regulator [Hyphomonadaceae bacterium]HPN05621.1 TetR family transcriptional regulator [Hyphomonadaceae bacterium]
MPTKQPVRRRNAAATREAILKSARKAFAKSGYDGAGVREIAEAAGVTAMLVNRYFGSKEQLFAEVVADTMSGKTVITDALGENANLAEYLVDGMLATTRPGETPLDGTLMMIRSSSSQRAAEIGKRQIEKQHHRRVTAALKGDHAEERAALVLALIAGVQFMRQMMKLSSLAGADTATLRKLLTPVMQQLIEPKPGKR